MDFNKLIQRVRLLLTAPKNEWPVIATEPATIGSLYTGYIVILAAIPALCVFLRGAYAGYDPLGLSVLRMDTNSALGLALLGYVVSLILVYLVALIIDALAPTFGGQKDRVQALKTTAYAYTASWVASFGYLLPWLGILILFAGTIYSIYLLYLGLPHTMKVPANRAPGYAAVTVLAAFVLNWIIGVISVGVMGSAAMGLSQR